MNYDLMLTPQSNSFQPTALSVQCDSYNSLPDNITYVTSSAIGKCLFVIITLRSLGQNKC